MSEKKEKQLFNLQKQFQQQGYVRVKNAIPDVLCWTAYRYLCHQSNRSKVQGNQEKEPYFDLYGDPFMETILELLQPRIESITNTLLWPTHSYARLYQHNDVLHAHKDRLSCEIAATVNLGQDFIKIHEVDGEYTWPIYMNGVPLSTLPSDMIIYRGCELEHWREALKGQQQGQVFLFYVEQNQPYAEACKFDGRPSLGLPINFRDKNRLRFAQRIKIYVKEKSDKL